MQFSVADSVSSKAYRQLRQRILNGRLKPGEPLRQRRMARELGVGITPLREAMVRLECDGLIETAPQWGSRVRLFSEQSIRQYFEFREAIECQTVRLCAQRASAKELDELAKLAQKVDDLCDNERDIVSGMQADAKFHAKIAECARSDLLLEQFERLQVLAQMAQIMQVHGQTGQPRTGTHTRLAKAIKSCDPDRAEAEMRKHLDPTINTARLVIRRTPEERS